MESFMLLSQLFVGLIVSTCCVPSDISIGDLIVVRNTDKVETGWGTLLKIVSGTGHNLF